MPIYEYACPDCSREFEVMQKISEPRLTVCPHCGGEHLRKLISRTSFVLKGSGWYKDHYGLKSGSTASDGARSGHGASHASSSSASTDGSAKTGSSSSTGSSAKGSSAKGSAPANSSAPAKAAAK